jgi:hypothetical protein
MDKLLKNAISDRDAHPWRYYRFEYDELRKWLDKVADERDALLAERDALLAQRGVRPEGRLSCPSRSERVSR